MISEIELDNYIKYLDKSKFALGQLVWFETSCDSKQFDVIGVIDRIVKTKYDDDIVYRYYIMTNAGHYLMVSEDKLKHAFNIKVNIEE